MANNKNIRFIIDNKFEVFPANTSKLRITHSRQQDQLFFRKKLSDSLAFIKNNCGGFSVNGDTNADMPLVDGYNYILSGVRDFGCKIFYIDIQVRCKKGTWLTKFKGMFSKYDCDYDLDANVIMAKVEPNDGYSCLLSKYDRKYNVYDGQTGGINPLVFYETKLVNTSRFVKYKVHTYDIPDNAGMPDTPDGYGFVLRYEYSYTRDVVLFVQEWATFKFANDAIKSDTLSTATTEYWYRPYNAATCIRGAITVAYNKPNNDWENIAQPVPLYANTAGVQYLSVNIRKSINVRYLLDNLVERLGCSIAPHSEGIFTYTANPVTGEAVNLLKRLYITQKSNVVRFYVSAPATIMQLTLKQVLGYIRHLFNIYMVLDGVDGNGMPIMRFEHISWFKAYGSDTVWDLTTTNPATNTGYNKYSYEKKDMPFKETWEVADYKDISVTYESNCANTETEAKFSESNIWLDINAMLGNDDSGYDGVVFFYGGASQYQGGTALNYWQTIKDYYKEERPFKQGTRIDINEPVNWNSTTMNKTQEDIIIPFCCETLSKQIVKTTLGVGSLDSAEEDLSAGTIKLKIKFQR